MWRLTLLLLVAAAVTLGAGGQRAQEPAQGVFRSSTALVEVDVIVKDRDGRFVSGLTADDFEVFEEGRPQPIQHFYLVTEHPTTSRDLPADVVLPRLPDQTGRRVFLLVFDDEHLSASRFARLKSHAMAFVNEHMRPRDLAGVFANGSLWRNRLSSDRQEVLDGIRAASPAMDTPESRLRPLFEWPRIEGEFEAGRIEAGDRNALDAAGVRNCTEDATAASHCALEGGREVVEDRLQQKARRFIDDSRRAANGTLHTLTYLTRNLSRLEGRKTLILLSEGFFTEDARTVLPQIAGQASRAGIAIYTLNARGTASGGISGVDLSQTGRGISRTGDTSQEGLDLLASQTGGLAFRHTDDFGRALTNIAADTSTHYVLAYAPENSTMDGRYRRIELKVKWDGLQIRARRGYLATPLPEMREIRVGSRR